MCASRIGWLGCGVADDLGAAGALHLRLHSRLHDRGAHPRRHHALATSSLRSRILILERLLELDSLNVLLVFDFFFHVLVSLQQLIVLSLSQLESLIQIRLKLLLEGIHLVLLLLNQL